MLYVSIFVELLRSRPALAVWLAALVQAALWTLVPPLFYAGPAGRRGERARGRHTSSSSAPISDRRSRSGSPRSCLRCSPALFGVYVLSQVCVVVTYWAVFALGRSIVGAQHAALAVLLMVGRRRLYGADAGLRARSSSPCRCGRSSCCTTGARSARAGGPTGCALAIEIGLLLLTTYVGLILVGLLVLFTLAEHSARARR